MNRKKENLNVILVDDMEEEHMLFRKALSMLPHLDLAITCLSSVAALQEHLATSTIMPHIIFLDMYMPDKNGLECLREIRNSSSYRELIVAMYSVSSADAVIGNCLAAGANIYITKPANFQSLIDRLQDAIKSCMQYHSMSINFETFVKCL